MTIERDRPYLPIDCDQHSRLEVLAMRRAVVSVRVLDDVGGVASMHGTVEDVVTRHAAEYLVVRDSAGHEQHIRLDRLQLLYDSTGVVIWRQKTDDADRDL